MFLPPSPKTKQKQKKQKNKKKQNKKQKTKQNKKDEPIIKKLNLSEIKHILKGQKHQNQDKYSKFIKNSTFIYTVN